MTAAQTLDLKPRVTDTVKVSILDWDDVIDRTALGFDQLKPPGLAEVTALDPRGAPIAAADAARNRDRPHRTALRTRPDHRRGRTVRADLDYSTTVGALLDGDPVAARPCQAGPIMLPAGQQELLISPGAAFAPTACSWPARWLIELPTRQRLPRRPAPGAPIPRGKRDAVAGLAGAGRPRKRQPRLDRTHRATAPG